MSEWQSIDTAPQDGSSVLVFARGDVFQAYWNMQYERWAANEPRSLNPEDRMRIFHDLGPTKLETRVIDAGPSHWMPLPEAPK